MYSNIRDYSYLITYRNSVNEHPQCFLCKTREEVERFCKYNNSDERIVSHLQDVSQNDSLSKFNRVAW